MRIYSRSTESLFNVTTRNSLLQLCIRTITIAVYATNTLSTTLFKKCNFGSRIRIELNAILVQLSHY